MVLLDSVELLNLVVEKNTFQAFQNNDFNIIHLMELTEIFNKHI